MQEFEVRAEVTFSVMAEDAGLAMRAVERRLEELTIGKDAALVEECEVKYAQEVN